MYVYLTFGTPDFMEKVLKKHDKENMFILYGTDSTVLLHETERKTVFASPRKFEVIDSVNQIEQKGFFVFNNIPVDDEGRPIFEQRFLSRSREIEKMPGFVAYRLLRPIKSEMYIVLTQWESKQAFDNWKESNAFAKAHSKPTPELGVKKQNIFNAASYISTYSGKLPEKK
ncbi:antibiotic biosynthesis monooxygenase family protein [Ureibacillus acetophenoni]|uniref:Heme-degrading monooxygenase HmoA n=1 Tax=Ureibacillus acetophenoni TaxID=614649 RepID=A0A285UE36_9BACL|nr:antibiotic biosynthesis monooxygenase [Ureibacillus acetophenoni]SOC40092.1 heme-degrading monooxygenase HmoA [Ureibacillus acetophenoni]